MYITNAEVLRNVEGFMRVQDVDCGECFKFLDEPVLYMRAGDYFFSVADAEEVFNIYDDDIDRPVRPIETALTVLRH